MVYVYWLKNPPPKNQGYSYATNGTLEWLSIKWADLLQCLFIYCEKTTTSNFLHQPQRRGNSSRSKDMDRKETIYAITCCIDIRPHLLSFVNSLEI